MPSTRLHLRFVTLDSRIYRSLISFFFVWLGCANREHRGVFGPDRTSRECRGFFGSRPSASYKSKETQGGHMITLHVIAGHKSQNSTLYRGGPALFDSSCLLPASLRFLLPSRHLSSFLILTLFPLFLSPSLAPCVIVRHLRSTTSTSAGKGGRGWRPTRMDSPRLLCPS